jgi:hypothetical protein
MAAATIIPGDSTLLVFLFFEAIINLVRPAGI